MTIRFELPPGCQFLDKNANHANITKTSFLLCHFLSKFRVNQEVTTNISLGNFSCCEQSQGSDGIQPFLQYFHCMWIFWQIFLGMCENTHTIFFPFTSADLLQTYECLGLRNDSESVTNELVLVSMSKEDILSTVISQKMPT